MKKSFIILTILFAGLLNSCIDQRNKENSEDQEFEFVLKGNVKNGEGKFLKLTIPSKYPNDTLISEIKNGRFLFKGKLTAVEKVGLSVVNKESNRRLPTRLFLTKDTIILDFELGEQFDELTFISDTIVKSDINLYARKLDKKYWEINSVWVFADSIKNDSMRQNIYPDVRYKTLALLNNELNKKEYSAIKLDYLRNILENNPVYSASDLSVSEKEQIEDLFIQTDTSLSNTPDYKIVESRILKFRGIKPITFKDFKFIDIKANEVTLSNIISKNKITVLDFWWSGCGPCRKFNKEAKPYYGQLKEKGIEIVAINVDIQNSTWRKSSKKDQIEWVNLYAGNNSTVIPDYQITAYPTKIVFDSNKKIIDFEFNTAEELLQVIK